MATMISINFLNGNGGGFAEVEHVCLGSTVRDFLNRKYDTVSGFSVEVNGNSVDLDYVMQNGDDIIAVRDDTGSADVLDVNDVDIVTFINNDGGGFADRVSIDRGTSIADFLNDMLPGVDLSSRKILVNGGVVNRTYVLQNGDRISATPLKIEGAADIRVLLVKNEGSGYSDYVRTRENITVGEFFSANMPGKNASNYVIRVNNAPVAAEDLIRNGDKVAITPNKITGA